MKKTLLALPLLLASSVALTAATVYSEAFSSQEGKGYDGTMTGDFTGVDWTIAGSPVGITATTDWFAVDGAQMSARDIDGDLTWTSPAIDISSITDPMEISIDLGASGDFEASGDVFRVSYQIDAGTPVVAFLGNVDEVAPGDPFFVGSTELTSTLATFTTGIVGSGSDLTIAVDINNSADDEFQFFDNVLLETIPEPSTSLLGALGLLALLRRRR